MPGLTIRRFCGDSARHATGLSRSSHAMLNAPPTQPYPFGRESRQIAGAGIHGAKTNLFAIKRKLFHIICQEKFTRFSSPLLRLFVSL